jgi:hypothetical protein
MKRARERFTRDDSSAFGLKAAMPFYKALWPFFQGGFEFAPNLQPLSFPGHAKAVFLGGGQALPGNADGKAGNFRFRAFGARNAPITSRWGLLF